MKFEVVRVIDKRVMFRYCGDTLPYDDNTLNIMDRSGYRFKVDGEFVSRSQLNKYKQITPDLSHAAPASAAIVTEVVSKPSKQVRCVETGEIFESQSAAARKFNIDPAQVSDSIKTGRKRSGYTFEKVNQ